MKSKFIKYIYDFNKNRTGAIYSYKNNFYMIYFRNFTMMDDIKHQHKEEQKRIEKEIKREQEPIKKYDYKNSCEKAIDDLYALWEEK